MTSNAYERVLAALAEHGSTVRERGDAAASAQCPAHEDRNPSLSLRDGAGQVLVYCHAGCRTEDVATALGLRMADLFDDRRGLSWTYLAEDGVTVLREVRRTPTKRFSQKVLDRSRVTLYPLPEVVEAVRAGEPVWLAEGEKDVGNLALLGGVTATTAPMGASNFGGVDVEPLRGATVFVVVDRDEAGDRWACDVAAALSGVCASLSFRRAKVGKDASDHLAAGLSLEDLEPFEPVPAEPSGDAETEFWAARASLRTIHGYARASMAAPWAVLGCVLARIAASVPPCVVLPPLGHGSKGDASLNTFVGLVAPSGGGKGVATRAAEAVLEVSDGLTIAELPLGSGEGIAAALVVREGKGDDVEYRPRSGSAWFDVAEVDTLTALVTRKGSTLAAEVRKMWSGEPLGFQNAQENTRRIVEAHKYRAVLVAGIQPRKAGPLLADNGGGTPQRFVYLPATDPDAPDDVPEAPAPIRWTTPVGPLRNDRTPLQVAAEVREQIRTDRLARLRGSVDDEDGHANLVRLKVAALLALLETREHVTVEDWDLAGTVMAVSAATRDQMRQALADAARETSRARAEADAHRQVLTDARMDDAATEDAARRVLTLLADGQTWSMSQIRRVSSKRLRPYVEAAVHALAAQGDVVTEKGAYQGQEGTWVKRSESR